MEKKPFSERQALFCFSTYQRIPYVNKIGIYGAKKNKDMSNENLSFEIKKSIRKYEPIEIDGLTLYPIEVNRYEEFLWARRSLDFLQQSLPIDLMSVPLLDAYYRMDIRAVENGEQGTGLFTATLILLGLALRLMPDGSIEDVLNQFAIVADRNDPTRLKCLRFTVNGEETHQITPIQFASIRPILAAQNGVELESEDANPELLEADRDLAVKNAPNLDMSVESMISAAALLTGKDEDEINEWPILKLENRLSAAKNIMEFMICGIGETQGTSWKGGNPTPHPWFRKIRDKDGGLIAIENFANGQGLQAIRNAEMVESGEQQFNNEFSKFTET